MVRCLRYVIYGRLVGCLHGYLYAVRTLFARCLYVLGKVKKIDNIYRIFSYIKQSLISLILPSVSYSPCFVSFSGMPLVYALHLQCNQTITI